MMTPTEQTLVGLALALDAVVEADASGTLDRAFALSQLELHRRNVESTMRRLREKLRGA